MKFRIHIATLLSCLLVLFTGTRITYLDSKKINRKTVNTGNGNINILHASPQAFPDEVILMGEGNILHSGPQAHADEVMFMVVGNVKKGFNQTTQHPAPSAGQSSSILVAKPRNTMYQNNLLSLHPEYAISFDSTQDRISKIANRESRINTSPYLSAAQGIEVHLAGLEWKGRLIENDTNNSIYTRYTQSISSIHFDPDDPDSGYPDLFISIENAPEIFNLGKLSGLLGKTFQYDRPIKTWQVTWFDESSLKAHTSMELWLVYFDVGLRIEPATSTRLFTGPREFKNQGYDNLTVFLMFQPKNDLWYITDDFRESTSDIDCSLHPAPGTQHLTPNMAIAAVECLDLSYNNPHTRLGVNLAKGKALPLYPALEELESIYAGQPMQTAQPQNLPVRFVDDERAVILNPALFNAPRYSAIEINSLGSWKVNTGSIWRGGTWQADQYHIRFLVHLYVIGDWMVKGENYVDYEARDALQVSQPGLLDYLLPDFRMGTFGKIFSGGIIVVILLVILSMFFPSILVLIRMVFSKIHRFRIRDRENLQ